MKKACIIGLARGYKDIKGYNQLKKRNRLLYKNFNRKYNYDTIIFHEGNISQDQQKYIGKKDHTIKFVEISDKCFKIPENLQGENPANWKGGSKFGVNYRHMCRFYAVQIFDYLKDYDWYMRLDVDSFIVSKIIYDIFDFMERNNYIYGYRKNHVDSHKMTKASLPKFTLNYIKENKITPFCGIEGINTGNFYNNFHITDLNFWRQKRVRDFLLEVDNSGGIYRYRWGDSTIQALAVKIFSPRDKTYRFTDFSYIHDSHDFLIKKNQ